ncbi:protein TIS11-like [Macrobrachium rosenbergii]|uniref:protein TIS11-like n=1 Tax=Macrobrachium rosenbergii TaxID=79674 RepID=UPI0034D50106
MGKGQRSTPKQPIRSRSSPSNGFQRSRQGTPPGCRWIHFLSPPSSAARESSLDRKEGTSQCHYRPVVQLRYKTELCKAFEENKVCRFGRDCTFAHGFAELRAVSHHPKYKSELCRSFHNSGFCLYGTRCHFVHNHEEIGGLSSTGRYLIHKHQREMLSAKAQSETNAGPAVNSSFKTQQPCSAQQTGKWLSSPLDPQHLVNDNCLAGRDLIMPLKNKQQVSTDTARTVASLLQGLGHMAISSPNISHDHLTEAGVGAGKDTSVNITGKQWYA